MEFRLNISRDEIRPALKRLRGRAIDPRPFFKRAKVVLIKWTRETFDQLGNGGSYRGVEWPWFAPQYTRKDGTVVPAEGGVAKVRGDGVVQGRLRPSGARVTSSSQLMRDKGRMSREGGLSSRMDRNKLELRSGMKYGGHQQKLRPWLFINAPSEVNTLRNMLIKSLERA